MERLFQFVPSRGGQLSLLPVPHRDNSFNSCPRAEGNRMISSVVSSRSKFQFVPSRGGQRYRMWRIQL